MRYLWFFNIERVMLLSPKAISEVLVTNSYTFIKPRGVRESIGRILGYGILLTEGDVHKVQRRNLQPAFAFRHIKDLYPIFWTKTREVVEAMTATLGEEATGEMEVMRWASRCTLDIIGVAGMGKDFGAIQDGEAPLVKTYNSLFEPSRQAQLLAVLNSILPTFIVDALPLQRNNSISKAAKEIRRECYDLIQHKKTNKAAGKANERDILSVAMDSGLFSDDNLVDQLMTFLAAGHETTATAMTWALYMLSRYPEIQTKLRDEVRAHISGLDADITSMDIDSMPYLQAVCNEVLRYWPPVPSTIRESSKNTAILTQFVPKGTRIVLAAACTNVDTALWGDDSREFRPERWLSSEDDGKDAAAAARVDASGGSSSNYAMLTFLHGPRSCIGTNFAKAEFACLLAGWIGRFEFELADKEMADESKLDIRGGITQRPTKGMHLIVKVVPGF